LLAHDLLQHSRLWRVSKMSTLFTPVHVNLRASVIDHPDPSYFTALGIGLAVSVITFIYLIWKSRGDRLKRQREEL
jgi:hypothetical protein